MKRALVANAGALMFCTGFALHAGAQERAHVEYVK
jgi:hypothetical protein